MDDNKAGSVDLAANLTIAWLNNPNVRANTEDATTFLKSMHETLTALEGNAPARSGGEEPQASSEDFTPAVSVRKSLASREHIISLIDGKPYKSLKRHLSGHGLTPDQYRKRYGLKKDYPMVAPAYSETRRAFAQKIGLGRKAGTARKTKQRGPGRA